MNILDLFDTADKHGIPVDYFRMGYAESMSIQDEDMNCYIAMDLTTFEGAANLKIHFAHELGHCLSGGFYTRSTNPVVRRRTEAKADAWAIEQLVPKDELVRRLQEIDFDVCDVADHFGVTLAFLHKAIAYYARDIDN